MTSEEGIDYTKVRLEAELCQKVFMTLCSITDDNTPVGVLSKLRKFMGDSLTEINKVHCSLVEVQLELEKTRRNIRGFKL